jgi:hypothetical protein
VILVVGAMTMGIAGGALCLAAAFAAVIVHALERTDVACPPLGNEDEFSVRGEPKWWAEFERDFADHVGS